MIVAVISDTHLPRGARQIPQACLERLRGADLILHAGDITTADVLEEIEALGPPVEAVHGNMDDAELCSRLPADRVVEAGGARIAMTHDPGPQVGREERLVRRFPGCDAVVYGHTHEPQVEEHAGVLILNPGSPTERRRSPSHSMLVLEIENGRITPQLTKLEAARRGPGV